MSFASASSVWPSRTFSASQASYLTRALSKAVTRSITLNTCLGRGGVLPSSRIGMRLSNSGPQREPHTSGVSHRSRQQPGLDKMRRCQRSDSSQRGFFDVVAVEQVQLFHIKNSRRRCNPLQREFLNQLWWRKDLARPAARRPTEKRKIVGQRFRQHPHFAEVRNRSRAVTLGKPLAIATENGGKVRELRHR